MACVGCARRREWIKKWMKKAYERATRNRTPVALKAQTAAQTKQTEAINRLANSNESLCKLIMQTLAEEVEEDNPSANLPE
jgi:predicted Fe-S protein YdhL (DUF1289 family)